MIAACLNGDVAVLLVFHNSLCKLQPAKEKVAKSHYASFTLQQSPAKPSLFDRKFQAVRVTLLSFVGFCRFAHSGAATIKQCLSSLVDSWIIKVTLVPPGSLGTSLLYTNNTSQ